MLAQDKVLSDAYSIVISYCYSDKWQSKETKLKFKNRLYVRT